MSEKAEEATTVKKKIAKDDDDEVEEEEKETETITTATTRKGPLGFNFNDPIVLAATVLGVSVGGILLWNFLRNFIWAPKPTPAQQQPAQPQTANVTVTPEQLRQAQYQRDLEMASRNMFATNMNTIEQTNQQIQNAGVHNDQYSNKYFRGKPRVFEEDIEIVDDNNDVLLTANNTYYKPAPPTIMINQPTFDTTPIREEQQQQQQPQKVEIKSQEIIDDDEIAMITSNEPQLDKIPQEFIAVGNSETMFDRIEPKPQANANQATAAQTQVKRKTGENDEVDFENLEIDADTLKQMEANAVMSKNDYY